MKKRFSSKAMSNSMIISVILAIIVLLVLLPYTINVVELSDVKSSDMQCQQFFKSINGKQAYFGDGMDDVDFGFVEMVSKLCPSSDVVVTSKNVDPAIELVESCFKKAGAGVDFLGGNVINENICLYCGKISTKDNVDDFEKLFMDEIKKEDYEYLFSDELEMINFNEGFLLDEDAVPNSIDEDESINVYYWVYRGGVSDSRNKAKLLFSKLFGSFKWTSKLSYLASDNVVDTYFGVMLTDKIEINEDDAIDTVEHHNDVNNCYVIVPDESN